MAAEAALGALTEDSVLGGRLRLQQPRSGHRVGHDAILLAAACPAQAGEHAVELGAGVGAAGLALAARVPDLDVTLVEIDPRLAELARQNAGRNGLATRVRSVVLDAAAGADAFATAGLPSASAMRVLMNPPFHDAARQRASPDLQRRLAHTGGVTMLCSWVQAAARLLRPRGTMTVIWRADGLQDVLQALHPVFGAMQVLPVHPEPQKPAIRLLVRATKGSRGPLSLLPGLVLSDEARRATAASEAILRGGATLPLAEM